MNDKDKKMLTTGFENLYIGYRLGKCTYEHLCRKFAGEFKFENVEQEFESHHCELYNMFDNMLLMNNGQKLKMTFYTIEVEENGIMITDHNGCGFLLKNKYEPLKPRYEVTSFTSFKPSQFVRPSNFKYDFVMEIKGLFTFLLYNCDSDSFYLLKDKEVTSVSREQVILPNDEMFFWNKFDELLEKYIVSCLDGNTSSCLRQIADCVDEYSDSVLKPDCFGLDKLLQFDEYLCWNSYCFEDSVMEVTKNVLQRFI